MTAAAKTGKVFHLWWHPEDFANDINNNFMFLEKILIQFNKLQDLYNMQTLTMEEVYKQSINSDSL